MADRDDQEEAEEARTPKRASQPLRTSAAEVDNHMLMHLSFRSW